MNNSRVVKNYSNNFHPGGEEEEEEEETAEDDEQSLTTQLATTGAAMSLSRPSRSVAAVRPTSLEGKRYCSTVTSNSRDPLVNNGIAMASSSATAPATNTTKVKQFKTKKKTTDLESAEGPDMVVASHLHTHTTSPPHIPPHDNQYDRVFHVAISWLFLDRTFGF